MAVAQFEGTQVGTHVISDGTGDEVALVVSLREALPEGFTIVKILFSQTSTLTLVTVLAQDADGVVVGDSFDSVEAALAGVATLGQETEALTPVA